MENKIACLDADIIIKTTANNSDMLDSIIEVFNKCYIHEYVYNEIKWPQNTIIKLDSLIRAKKIKVLNDEQLYKMIENKSYFLNTLEKACEIFAVDYNKYYSDLENIDVKNDFIKNLRKHDKLISSNLGETKTLQMIILFRDLFDNDINYFLSEDRRARRGMILKFSQTTKGYKIHGISLIGAFYLLKNSGISEQKALEFKNELGIQSNKVYNSKNNMENMDAEIIINKIYNEEFSLLKTGDLKLQN